MLKLTHWAGGIALAVACAGAGAQLHHICYEGPAVLANHDGVGTLDWTPTAVFGCAMDVPGRCEIVPTTGGLAPRASQSPAANFVQPNLGTFRFFEVTTPMQLLPSTHAARIDYFDTNSVKIGERQCSMTARLTYGGESWTASYGAVLTSFSTDASGLATTGVWRGQAAQDAANHMLHVWAPGDFIAVGGGAMGVDSPTGAIVTGSTRFANLPALGRKWMARTSEAGGAAQPHRATAWVIGLRIQGLTGYEILQQLQVNSSTSHPALVPHPATQVTQGPGTSVVIGGGFDAYAPANAAGLFGQFGTLTAPVWGQQIACTPWGICRYIYVINGWRAESKDHVISRPGWVNASLLSLPGTLTINGQSFNVVSQYVSATSGQAAHPAVNVSGLRGEFTLTTIGATVNWRRFDSSGQQVAMGNLLWKLEPRADIGGASVASKDHLLSSPATITAHAIGIKLVPVVPILKCIGC